VNRSITLLGVFVLLLAIGSLVWPLITQGVLVLDPIADTGIVVFPAALMIILWGVSRPDPAITTVGGVFGNPEENVLRKQVVPPSYGHAARHRPGPRESVNCRRCYTAVPADLLDCPRCGTRRLCRECGKPLDLLSGGVRCVPCVKDEIFCDCPRASKFMSDPVLSRPRGH
jgi:hypothetical protein